MNESDLIVKGMSLGAQIEAFLDDIKAHLRLRRGALTAGPDDEPTDADFAALAQMARAEPDRWLALGRTDMQRGLMEALRAVTMPTGF